MQQKDNVVDMHDARRTDRKKRNARPTELQRAWLARGLKEPGGKLPLFDDKGQRINGRTVKSCITQGWAEPWFDNPTKPDWLVCKLTEAGRRLTEKLRSGGRQPSGAPRTH